MSYLQVIQFLNKFLTENKSGCIHFTTVKKFFGAFKKQKSLKSEKMAEILNLKLLQLPYFYPTFRKYLPTILSLQPTLKYILRKLSI